MKPKFQNLVFNELSIAEKNSTIGGRVSDQTGRDSRLSDQTGRDGRLSDQTGRDGKQIKGII